MKKLLLLLLVCNLAFGVNYRCESKHKTPSHVALTHIHRTTYPTVNESLVYIDNGCGHMCSGVIIDKNLVLTAAHCVAGPPYYFVHYSDGQASLAGLMTTGDYIDQSPEDWALITTDTGNRKPLKLACGIRVPSKGIDLTCGGEHVPDQQTYPVQFTDIKQYSIMYPNANYLGFIGPIDYGDSGSPLLDSDGNVVGVVSELGDEDNTGKAVTLHTLVTEVAPFLKSRNSCPVKPHEH